MAFLEIKLVLFFKFNIRLIKKAGFFDNQNARDDIIYKCFVHNLREDSLTFFVDIFRWLLSK